MTYQEFLLSKVPPAHDSGFDIDPCEVHPLLKPHQRDIVCWAVKKGRAAIFAAFGLGKSVMQLEIARLILKKVEESRKQEDLFPFCRFLIVAPLGVRQEFIRDAEMIGLAIKFVRRIEECGETGLYLTNYETIRDGKMDPRQFTGVSLDEAGILRGFGGTKTFRKFMALFEGTSIFRFVGTATPSPNEFIELLAYAGFLDVMDIGQAKTRFFKRDSTKADVLTIHPHKEREFWLWVSTWAIFLQRPSDIGYSDEGYALPDVEVHWHEIPSNYEQSGYESNGQGRLVNNSAIGVTHAAREKRSSLPARIEKLMELRALAPDEHRLIWHDLEDERRAIEKAIPGIATVYGKQIDDDKVARILDFADGIEPELGGKLSMLSSGCNFQRHCAWAIYLGINFQFHAFIQGFHRIVRFLQTRKVRVDIIYTEAEREIRRTLERKWAQHNELVEQMSQIIRQYGLATNALQAELRRGFGVERQESRAESYCLVNSDAVLEVARMPDNYAGLILTSIPFCYDEQTQILARRGWIGFGELSVADEVATVNQEKLCFEWQYPSAVVWERYDGEMLQFGSRVFDLAVTPNHRMFAARRGPTFDPRCLRLVQADAIAKEYESTPRLSAKADTGRILRGWRTCVLPPSIGDGWKPDRIEIPPLPKNIRAGHGVELYWIAAADFMALAGWYLSEGHADPFEGSRQGGRLSIAQVTNQAKRQEISDLFSRIGLPPTWHSRQITVWCRNLSHFLISEFGTGSRQKFIPEWVRNMHPELLTILRDTMMKGDGSGNRVYISSSEKLRNHFQEICLKTGWRATIKGWHVKVGTCQVYPEIRSAPKRVQYSGMIGCATVPNGLLIVRRNGKPCISGNSTQYEYSPNYADFGHCDDNPHFFRQFDFLTPDLFRVLQPGRVAGIHVKDRIVPGGMTGLGFQTVYPFHCDTIAHFVKHGFAYLGMKTIVTDVVRENNQTYRLGWTEQCKDGSRMGVGMPEYLLLFRKPPTDSSNGYADVPVVKSKPECFCKHQFDVGPNGFTTGVCTICGAAFGSIEGDLRIPYNDKASMIPGSGYSRSRWQIDAHGFMRSSGNRLLCSSDLERLPHEKIFKLFREFSKSEIYDFEKHVALGEALEVARRLPVTFMLLQPQSWHPDAWTDITRMLTLNGSQYAQKREPHLCPMQIDLADRVISQFSMKGEVVFDPFAGLGTVPLRAVKLGRFGHGIELSPMYWQESIRYLQGAEEKARMPTLFDMDVLEETGEAVLGG